MYWLFILGKKKTVHRMLVKKFIRCEFTKDLSIATMNVILQMSIRGEYAYEKNYRRKNKNLRKQYKTVQNLPMLKWIYLHYGTRISNSIERCPFSNGRIV